MLGNMTIVLLLSNKKEPYRALSTGYANPATRYFVSDLKRVKNQRLILIITFPTRNQLLLQQYSNVLQLHLMQDLQE